VIASRDLPTKYIANNANQPTHGDDIMSAVYDHINNLVFTGGHDGTLLAWHFETGFIKYYMHNQEDPKHPMVSTNYIKESKSVDTMVIMQK